VLRREFAIGRPAGVPDAPTHASLLAAARAAATRAADDALAAPSTADAPAAAESPADAPVGLGGAAASSGRTRDPVGATRGA
jgi:hypothetical protein